MKILRRLIARFTGMFPNARREEELSTELEAYIDLATTAHLREGMSPQEARRTAILSLGGVEHTKQAYREGATLPLLEDALHDLTFAVRQLRKNLGFTITAILMLTLGVGSSTALFTFVDAALIKPLPYPQPNRLAAVTESMALFPRANLSYMDYLDWKKDNTVFESLEVFTGTGYLLSTPSGTEPVSGERVTDGFFRTLGIKPLLGRDFYVGEDQPNAPKTVILSYATWQRRFNSDAQIIGKAINLTGIPTTVVGVLPQSFQFAPRGRTEFWVPIQPSPTSGCESRRSCHDLDGIARLKNGVTVEQALANMSTIAAQLESRYPDSNRGQGASVIPLSEEIVGDVRPILLALLGGAALLLAIACLNVSSLLLVRSESRRREIAVRGALGASPTRIMRQFVTEGLLLVGVGSVLGLLAAFAAIGVLMRLISKDMLGGMPYLQGLGLNLHVLLFALSVSLLAAALFSIAPALRLPSKDMHEGLTEAGGRGSAGTVWRRFGSNLVVLELAIAVVLLAGAGLLGKSFYRLLHVELGFNPDHLATLSVILPNSSYSQNTQQVEAARRILGSIAALPGVQSVGTSSLLAVSGNGNTDWIRFVGRPYDGTHNEVNERDISSNYFTTLQARLLQGRLFREDEDATKPKVAIINQALAKRYFPNEDPIGKRLGDTSLTPTSIKEIVGVVDDVREGSLDQETWPTIYYPYNQGPDTYMNVAVRTTQEPGTILPLINATLRKIDPGIGTSDETTMQARINESQTVYLHRSAAWLVGGFAALALLMGVVGLYGVVAYSVSQRTREIGVRMALGAQRATVYKLILREAGWLALGGIAAGLVASVGAATMMKSLLFGTQAWDLPTLAAVAVLLGLSACSASFLPARRAASINPVEALRAE